MLKLFTIIYLILSTCNLVYAQGYSDSYDLTFGKIVDVSGKELHQTIFTVGTDDFYSISTFTTHNSGFTIYQFSSGARLVKSREFHLKYRKHDLWYVGMLEMGDKTYLISTYTDKKSRISYLYKQEFLPSKFGFSPPIEINRAANDIGPKGLKVNFQYILSPDSNFVMFLSSLPSYKYEKNQFELLVYNTDFDTLWSKSIIEIGNKDENYLGFKASISNSGNVYVLARILDHSRKLKFHELDYRYRLLEYNNGGSDPKVVDLFISDRYIMDADFTVLDDGSINICGYYSQEGFGQKGVFSWEVSFDSIIDSSYIGYIESPFPTDFITQFESERDKSKAYKSEQKGKEVVFEGVEVKEIVTYSDSSYTLIGEKYEFFISTQTAINSQISHTYHYIYSNIIIAKFSKNGKVEWLEQIPKEQHTLNDQGHYSSFFMSMMNNDKLVFIFNDHPKNNYVDLSGDVNTWSGSTRYTDVILYQLELEGKLTRSYLFNGLNEQVICSPIGSVKISDNKIIVVGEDRKLIKMVVLDFE